MQTLPMDVDVVAAAEKLMAPDGEKGFVAVSAEGPAQAALGQVVKTQAALAPTDEQLVKEDLDESIGNSLHPRQLDHEFSKVDDKLLLQDLVAPVAQEYCNLESINVCKHSFDFFSIYTCIDPMRNIFD